MPGPRGEPMEERLALSKEALKIKGMPSSEVIFLTSDGDLAGQPFILDDAGPGDQEEPVVGDFQIVDLEESLHDHDFTSICRKGQGNSVTSDIVNMVK